MPITEKQLERKHKPVRPTGVIGGSQLAQIMDHRVGNVYASLIYGMNDFTTDAMQAGTWLEDAILQFAASRLGPMKRNQYRRVKGSPIGTHIDAIVDSDGNPVEAKSCGVISTFTDTSGWGEEGTGEVPEDCIIQCHGEMMAAERGVCHVPALIGGRDARGFCMFRVERNDELVELLEIVARRFWDEHVVPLVPPDDEFGEVCLPTLDVLKRIRREPNSIVPVEPTVVDKWLAAKAFRKMVEDTEDGFKAAILMELGDAEAGELPDGRTVTYLEQERRGINLPALRADHAELAEKYGTVTKHRVMRIKKAKD